MTRLAVFVAFCASCAGQTITAWDAFGRVLASVPYRLTTQLGIVEAPRAMLLDADRLTLTTPAGKHYEVALVVGDDLDADRLLLQFETPPQQTEKLVSDEPARLMVRFKKTWPAWRAERNPDAEAMFRAGKFSEAVSRDAKLAYPLYLRAVALGRAGQSTRKLEFLKMAYTADPKNDEILRAYSVACLIAGDCPVEVLLLPGAVPPPILKAGV